MAKYDKGGFTFQRRRGWGMGLYRNRREAWIAGVCAGLADHWRFPRWGVRLGAVVLLFFTGSLAFWGYVAAVLLLATQKQSERQGGIDSECGSTGRASRSTGSSHDRYAPTERLRRARARLDHALGRVEAMERYVTSRRYELNEKFSRL